MDHATWNTSVEERCIKGNWKWKKSTTKWPHHVDLPDNIISPEENTIEQPNDINENELLKIKETLANAYAESIVTLFDERFNLRKLRRKAVKISEKSLEKVLLFSSSVPFTFVKRFFLPVLGGTCNV